MSAMFAKMFNTRAVAPEELAFLDKTFKNLDLEDPAKSPARKRSKA